MRDPDEVEAVRKRLATRLREIRRFTRGLAERPPTQEEICIWIELAYVLECYDDAIDLSTHLFEAEADPWLYRRARRLVRLARIKTKAQHAR